MTEYIDREKTVEILKQKSLKMFNSYYKGYIQAIKDLIDVPSADVQPIVNAHWIDKTTWFGSIGKCCYECSECGYQIPHKPQSRGDGKGGKWCDECGARMDGDNHVKEN